MKKIISCLALGAILLMPFGVSNEAVANPIGNGVEVQFSDDFAECKIEVEGFSASGRCGAVLRAYRKWKRMQ